MPTKLDLSRDASAEAADKGDQHVEVLEAMGLPGAADDVRLLTDRIRALAHLPPALLVIPSFRIARRAFERDYVERLLTETEGNVSRAARLAEKDRKDFYDLIARTGIDPEVYRERRRAG